MKEQEEFSEEWKKNCLKLSKFELVNALIESYRKIYFLEEKVHTISYLYKKANINKLLIIETWQLN